MMPRQTRCPRTQRAVRRYTRATSDSGQFDLLSRRFFWIETMTISDVVDEAVGSSGLRSLHSPATRTSRPAIEERMLIINRGGALPAALCEPARPYNVAASRAACWSISCDSLLASRMASMKRVEGWRISMRRRPDQSLTLKGPPAGPPKDASTAARVGAGRRRRDLSPQVMKTLIWNASRRLTQRAFRVAERSRCA